MRSHQDEIIAYNRLQSSRGHSKQLHVASLRQDYLPFSVHAALEVHITLPIVPVSKEKDLIVRTEESDYLAKVLKPIV